MYVHGDDDDDNYSYVNYYLTLTLLFPPVYSQLLCHLLYIRILYLYSCLSNHLL